MTIENELSIMETWLADIESLFKGGLTGVHFESKQWAAITLNSGLQTAIDQQTSAVAGGLGNSDQDNLIGTEIKAGAFQALESKRAETIERGAYGSYNLLKFHIYENGLIVKEYQLGTRKPIQYEVVKEVEEEFDDGGFRELDNYFEGTKLAFVDYIHPRAIVQKGFKKMALAIIPGVKPSKYKGNLPVKKTPAVDSRSDGNAKRPEGYRTGDVDEHGYLSPGVNRALGNKNIASDKRIQSHHPIQNEWAKRWAKRGGFDYSEKKAHAILLPSITGQPHAEISSMQRRRRKTDGFDTDIRYEFNESYREMIEAGVEQKSARRAIGDSYKYFDKLGGFVK
ncbi:hypothetical protein [Sporosarcina sp. FA15]|uniref:hypothetical protein n=1 Tax=Sporosarcina sp. FA15 TaxID=3413031 RepID=UPI003F659B0A